MNPNDPLERIKQKRAEASAKQTEDARSQAIVGATTESKDALTQSMHDILMATMIGKDPRLAEVASNLVDLLKSIKEASENVKQNDTSEIKDVFRTIADTLRELPQQVAETDKSENLIPYLETLTKAVLSIDVSPSVTVSPNVDFKPVIKAIKDSKVEIGDDRLEAYKAQDIDSTDPNRQYVGFIKPDGGWYIIENDMANNSLRYVFGKSGYIQAMKSPAKLNYRLYSEAVNEA